MPITVTSIQRVSTNAVGDEGNGESWQPVWSPDGTKVLFNSNASNLIANDTNSATDIFLKDLTTGEVTRITTDPIGNEIDTGGSRSISWKPLFSPDGTRVMFTSESNEFVTGPAGPEHDVFIKDLISGAVTLVSADSFGVPGNDDNDEGAFSPDGTKVAFISGASNWLGSSGWYDIYLKDLTTGELSLVSSNSAGEDGNDYGSREPVFSPDGTKIAFRSSSNNLVPFDTNGVEDVFVKDLLTGSVIRVSTGHGDAQSDGASSEPVWSPDGTKIVFQSNATNLVSGDSNRQADVFIKDLVTGTVVLISADASGMQGNASSTRPTFSPDATRVAFFSDASNFLSGDGSGSSDLFIKDLVTGELIHIASGGSQSHINGWSDEPMFSPDGTKIVFHSTSPSLVANDTNASEDIFVATLSVSPGLYGTGLADTINGTAGADIIYGFQGADILNGRSGDDFMRGGAGDDRMNGSDGIDRLRGDDGNDTIAGDSGNDDLRGGAGNDNLSGGDGNDLVYGDAGDDYISGGAGNDDVRGGAGTDQVFGSHGDDRVMGGDGDDTLNGGTGNDLLYGENDNDTLRGGSGLDILRGGAGNDDLNGDGNSDTLYGDFGNDVLNGGSSADRLFGGLGADTFVFDQTAIGTRDTIADFNLAEGDVLRLQDLLTGYDPLTSAITDFVNISQSASLSYLRIDADGAANGRAFVHIARIDGVTGLTDEAALLASGNLQVA